MVFIKNALAALALVAVAAAQSSINTPTSLIQVSGCTVEPVSFVLTCVAPSLRARQRSLQCQPYALSKFSLHLFAHLYTCTLMAISTLFPSLSPATCCGHTKAHTRKLGVRARSWSVSRNARQNLPQQQTNASTNETGHSLLADHASLPCLQPGLPEPEDLTSFPSSLEESLRELPSLSLEPSPRAPPPTPGTLTLSHCIFLLRCIDYKPHRARSSPLGPSVPPRSLRKAFLHRTRLSGSVKI